MTDPRRRSPPSAWLVCLLACTALGVSSCVYFNTYYNAQKYFRQAEKARIEFESGTDEGNRRNRAAQHITLYDKAVRKASVVLEKHPDSDLVDDAMFLAGRALYWQGDYQYAIRSFSDLEGNFPDSEFYDAARLWRARTLAALGRSAEASALLNLLINEGSAVGDRAGLRLGELAAAAGDERGAIGEYRRVLSTFSSTGLAAQLWVRIGRAYMSLGSGAQLDSALVAFERALSASPPDSVRYRARLESGRVQYLQGRPEEALATYRGLLGASRFREWEGETRILIGQYQRQRGELALALDEFERVRDDFPQTSVSAMALYETGLLYLQGYGERGRAEEYFAQVSEEKRGSVADSLARDMLQTGSQLDALIDRIWLADSTAAALGMDALAATQADSMAALSPGDSTAAALPTDAPRAARVDSMGADSLATTRGDSMAADALEAAAAPAADVAAPVAPAAPVRQAPKLPEALKGYRVAVDGEGRWTPLVARPDWRDEGDTADDARPRRRARPAASTNGRETLLEQLFSVAEIYRDRLGMPDSAAVFYDAIVERFPDSDERPRALYSLAWIHQELYDDAEAARPYLERLVAEYGASAHANAARRLLGLPLVRTAQEEAMAVFRAVEDSRFQEGAQPQMWIAQLDSLSHTYPGTPAAARAAFLAAWSTENDLGDSVAAETRYDSVAARFPRSRYADLVDQRRRAQRDGLLARMERELHTLGQGLRPEERLTLLAAEPDSVDSTILARQNLGFALRAHRHGRYERAAELYQASLDEQQGRNGNARAGLGDITWRQGYFEEAVGHMRQAIKDGATSPLPYYRLFGYHVLETQADSANHYLRQIARRDRESPAVLDLLDRYPTLASAEPQDLDLDQLETLEIEPSDETLQLDPALFGVGEKPIVRSLRTAVYPEGRSDSASVIVDVLIDTTGAPAQVEVFSGQEPFAEAARAAVQAYRFYPAEDRRQRPMAVWAEVTIPFAPPAAANAAADQETAAAPEGGPDGVADAGGVVPPAIPPDTGTRIE